MTDTIEYTIAFVATTYYDTERDMWLPQVDEYRSGVFSQSMRCEYPCQEQELALVVAQAFRDDLVQLAQMQLDSEVTRMSKRLLKPEDFVVEQAWDELVNDIVDSLPEPKDFDP